MLAWHWLGRANYRRVLADQLAARERVWAGGDGVVLLCEHPPTITLGRSADRTNILANPGELAAAGVAVEQIERGGDVTYHGPGQLMIYPIVRLRRGVVDFLACVGTVIADACAALGGPGGEWRRDPAGVWVGDAKLAACGIHVARGVSIHGFALDVATPGAAWDLIRACGLTLPHTSLKKLRGQTIDVASVAAEAGPRLVTALAS